MKCHRCGLESEIQELFFKTPRSGWRRFGFLCPQCWVKQRMRNYWLWFSATLFLGAAGATLVLAAPRAPLGWIIVNYFLFLVFLMVAIVPHEVGHALAARALGLRLFD